VEMGHLRACRDWILLH